MHLNSCQLLWSRKVQEITLIWKWPLLGVYSLSSVPSVWKRRKATLRNTWTVRVVYAMTVLVRIQITTKLNWEVQPVPWKLQYPAPSVTNPFVRTQISLV
uniref:Uncharacterized protein n=1 Tax=Cacopsylla melanoneura TaxID=428564 RepID=A0A8D8TCP1_9HEMI